MATYIEKIEVKNFKKFDKTTVNLSPFSILMGENSSGKTTILQAIYFALRALYEEKLVFTFNGKPTARSTGRIVQSLPGVPLADRTEIFHKKKTRISGGTGAIGAEITLHDTINNVFGINISYQWGSFYFKIDEKRSTLNSISSLYSKKPLFISGFISLSETEERAFPVAISDRLAKGQVSTVLRNLLLDTKGITAELASTKYDLLKARLLQDFSFHLSDVSFNQQNDLFVRAAFSEKSLKIDLDFVSSGSGFMQILQILTPIYRYCPETSQVVLLDEPDAHLHPNMQVALAKTLKSIQEELGIQIIISTHSTSIIKEAKPNEVYAIDHKKQSISALTTASQVDDEITKFYDNYQLAKISLSGKIIFFEDSNLELFERIAKLNGLDIFEGSKTIPTMKGIGKDSKLPYQTRDLIYQLTGQTVKVFLVLDSDGMTDETRLALTQYASTKGVELLILNLHESESYLLSYALFNKTFQETTTPRPTEQEFNFKLYELLRSTITLASYNYRDKIEESLYKIHYLLLKDEEFRSPRGKANEIRQSLEAITNDLELLRYGMGKEVLKSMLNWLKAEYSLNSSKLRLINAIHQIDTPVEITDFLTKVCL